MRRVRLPGLLAFASLSFSLSLAAACGDDGPAGTDDAAVDDAAVDAASDAAGDAEIQIDAGGDIDHLPGWGTPQCAGPSIGSVTWTTDEGATLAPAPALAGTTYTFSIASLYAEGNLLAAIDTALWRSTDAGCTWTSIGDLETDFGTIVVGEDSVDDAYGFGDNRNLVFSVDGSTLTTHGTDWAVVGLGIPGDDADHVRVVSDALQIYDSKNGGESWSPVGVPATAGVIAYRAVFDPDDSDHVVVGVSGGGARYTINGGTTWYASTGLGTGGVNVFNLAFSPAQPGLVYAEGLDLTEPDGSNRHIWRSTNGGESFTRIVDQSPEVILYNGNPLFPHPTNPGVLYFTFGASFQNYGTDLYRWEGDDVTKTHNGAHRTFGMTFSPSDPSLMYLGISHENVQ